MPAAVRDRLVSVETQPLLCRRRCSIFHLFRETLTPHEVSLLQSGITRNEHSLRRLGLLNCASDWPNHLLMSIFASEPRRHRDLARGRFGSNPLIVLFEWAGAVNSPALPLFCADFHLRGVAF